jgi:PadR family transcriptional regulator, regulatory protein PadR
MTTDQFAKDLATGSYDLLVLNALCKRPMYGYEIVRLVATRSKQTIRWHFGTVYHVLHDLERRGLVRSHWKPAGRVRERRYYRLTARGRTTWRRERAQWQAFSTSVNTLLGL